MELLQPCTTYAINIIFNMLVADGLVPSWHTWDTYPIKSSWVLLMTWHQLGARSSATTMLTYKFHQHISPSQVHSCLMTTCPGLTTVCTNISWVKALLITHDWSVTCEHSVTHGHRVTCKHQGGVPIGFELVLYPVWLSPTSLNMWLLIFLLAPTLLHYIVSNIKQLYIFHEGVCISIKL